MRTQYQDLCNRFDHDIEQYIARLQTNIPSTPPVLPPPGPEEFIQTVSEQILTQCRDEIASVRSLHVQSEGLLDEMLCDQTRDKLSKEMQSLVDKRLKICQSIIKCNRLSISKTEKT